MLGPQPPGLKLRMGENPALLLLQKKAEIWPVTRTTSKGKGGVGASVASGSKILSFQWDGH